MTEPPPHAVRIPAPAWIPVTYRRWHHSVPDNPEQHPNASKTNQATAA